MWVLSVTTDPRVNAAGWIRILVVVGLAAGVGLAQTPPPTASSTTATTNPWAFNLVVDGYVIPQEQGYASPILTADHKWLHLEARYNDENFRTGSLWIGRNFSVGKKLVFAITPMIGGVFGRTTGIAPGCESSLTYKKVSLSISNEYVFDTGSKSGNFYYSWPELTYTPLSWLKMGGVAEHTKLFQTKLDVQRGFLVGLSHKQLEFTTYIFNAGFTDPTVVYEVGFKF